MDARNSFITQPRDYTDIIHLQPSTVIEEFLDKPLSLMELVTGALGLKLQDGIVAGGRLIQALFRGQVYEQLHDELRALREAGKISDESLKNKYGRKSWVDLMSIIDEDSPDEDRLDALKAAFYGLNKVGLDEKERVMAYQLWQAAKKLESGDVLLLKTFYERNDNFGEITHGQWLEQLASISALGDVELIQLHMTRLVEFRLLVQTPSGMNRNKAQLSSLGRRLYANLQTYKTDVENAKRKAKK